jgi:hypothetical protein
MQLTCRLLGIIVLDSNAGRGMQGGACNGGEKGRVRDMAGRRRRVEGEGLDRKARVKGESEEGKKGEWEGEARAVCVTDSSERRKALLAAVRH